MSTTQHYQVGYMSQVNSLSTVTVTDSQAQTNAFADWNSSVERAYLEGKAADISEVIPKYPDIQFLRGSSLENAGTFPLTQQSSSIHLATPA